jgi:hypothetical protein
VKPDQIDVLAATVLCDLEEVDYTLETRLPRQLWSDIRETDRQDRIHLDLALLHPVAVTDLDVGARPDSDAARDFAATNALSQALREDHAKSLPRHRVGSGAPRGFLNGKAIPHDQSSRCWARAEMGEAKAHSALNVPTIKKIRRRSRRFGP